MSIRRSPSALASMHIFYQVDIVVFCEGGQSLSIDDAFLLGNIDRTIDNMFWHNVALLNNRSKKFHFKSVGSKPTLRAIAQDIDNLNITTVSVCMDSDYDVILGSFNRQQRVAHTYGYSWESDVLDKTVLNRILGYLVGPVSQQIKDDFNSEIDRFTGDLVKWCEIDISLKKKNEPSILNREKPLSSMDNNSSPICVNIAILSAKLAAAGYRRRPNRVVTLSQGDILRCCFGKIVSRSMHKIVLHFAKSVMPKTGIDYDNFMKIALQDTFSLISLGLMPHLDAHYKSQISAFS